MCRCAARDEKNAVVYRPVRPPAGRAGLRPRRGVRAGHGWFGAAQISVGALRRSAGGRPSCRPFCLRPSRGHGVFFCLALVRFPNGVARHGAPGLDMAMGLDTAALLAMRPVELFGGWLSGRQLLTRERAALQSAGAVA